MKLARALSRIYKNGGIILIDAQGTKYIIGEPKPIKPTTLKLLKKNLSWKLVLDPEFSFPEAYMRNEIVIENSSLHDFLMEFVKNLGRKEITLPELAISWLLYYENITSVICGVRSIEQLNMNIKSANCLFCFGIFKIEA